MLVENEWSRLRRFITVVLGAGAQDSTEVELEHVETDGSMRDLWGDGGEREGEGMWKGKKEGEEG